MPQSSLGDLLTYLRKVCASQENKRLPDGDLLARFLTHRDDAAFAIMVQRHGPMVLSVCQRLLSDSHAAEDAFQATFMVLARRAASVLRNQPLAGWLHGVARRVAVRAAAQTTARQSRERRHIPMQSPEPTDDLNWQELRAVLDEEIGRLPEKYRLPIVLCYLEGQTHDKAARELGVAKSSLTTRLARARELLRGQLARRGITLSIGALTTALADNALAAPMAAFLAINTVKAAASVAAGKAVVGGLVSARALLWAEQAMTGIVKAKMAVCVCVLAVGVALGGAGLAGYGAADSANPSHGEHVQAPAKVAPQKKEPVAGVDVFGDLLPAGVVARLGTLRFRPGEYTLDMMYLPGGKILATAGSTHFGICLWDAATGQLVKRFPIGTIASNALFSPNGKLVLTAIEGSAPRVLEVATGRELSKLETPWPHVNDWATFAFSPDGTNLITGGEFIRLWEVATGKPKRDLNGHSDRTSALAISRDGVILVSASKDNTIRLCDVAAGKLLRRIEGHGKGTERIVVSPNCKSFVSFAGEIDSDGSSRPPSAILIWDLATGKILHRLAADSQALRHVAFSIEGNLLASAYAGGLVVLWDPQTGKEVRRWNTGGSPRCMTFSPDDTILATAGSDSAIHRWDIATGKEIDRGSGLTEIFQWITFAPDGKSLMSSTHLEKVVDWDLLTNRPRRELFVWPAEPSGRGFLSAENSITAELAAVVRPAKATKKPQQLPAIELFDARNKNQLGVLRGHPTSITRVRISPNNKMVVSRGPDGIRLWDVATCKEIRHFPENPKSQEHYLPPLFSPDSMMLAYAKAKSVHLYEIASGKELHQWPSEQQEIDYLVFSPDSSMLAVSGEFRRLTDSSEFCTSVQVWSTTTKKEVSRFNTTGFSYDFAFSSSGRVLAFSSYGNRPLTNGKVGQSEFIELREAYSGQEIGIIDSAHGMLSALAFSPNGRILASGGEDSTILLWDLTGQPKLPPLSLKVLDTLWSDLAADASKAEKAIWKLAFAPKQSLPFLNDRLLAPPAPAEQLAKLIADLDSDRYAVRQEAVQALEKLGDRAEVAIWKALKNNPTLEAKQRLEQILKKQGNEIIRKLRAIEAIEHCENPAAAALLQALANDAPNPKVAEAARAALQRLSQLK